MLEGEKIIDNREQTYCRLKISDDAVPEVVASRPCQIHKAVNVADASGDRALHTG